ncbi:MAG: hypothetical protein CVV46_11450 [Spirochaetae bacterium HGW-Spirochaetae-2]|jgi:hypothetical protein|nr:MAG: hypothetical protein CVV46_11450 [Spirochaetae bacterium HGW-Spirochaetae-2]
MAVSVGQITIMDFNDAVTLTGYISGNHTKNVRYDGNNETYTPDFVSTPLVLTPSLFVAGSGTDIMASGTNVQSVGWKRKANNQTGENNLSAGESVGASFPKALTVASQPFSTTVFSVEYICTIVYRDPATALDLTYKNSVTVQKVTEGNNIAIAEVSADPGFAFKNALPASITLSAHLYRGATKDTTNLTYVWEKLVAGTWTAIGGATGATHVVTASMVASLQQFRVKIGDSVVGDTYTSDPVSVLDFNDPVQVVIESTGGMVFKNGVGTSTLKAKLFQNGSEVDAGGTGYTYTWTVLNKDGSARNFADATSSKTGKTISVGTSDVDVKSTFVCTVG